MFFENGDDPIDTDTSSCSTETKERDEFYNEDWFDIKPKPEGKNTIQKFHRGGKQSFSGYNADPKAIKEIVENYRKHKPDADFREVLGACFNYDPLGVRSKEVQAVIQEAFETCQQVLELIQKQHNDLSSNNILYFATVSAVSLPLLKRSMELLDNVYRLAAPEFVAVVESACDGFNQGYQEAQKSREKPSILCAKQAFNGAFGPFGRGINGYCEEGTTKKVENAMERSYIKFCQDVNDSNCLKGSPTANLEVVGRVIKGAINNKDDLHPHGSVTGGIGPNGNVILNNPLNVTLKNGKELTGLFTIKLDQKKDPSGFALLFTAGAGSNILPPEMTQAYYEAQLKLQNERVKTFQNVIKEAGTTVEEIASWLSAKHPSPQPKNKLDQFAEKAIESLTGQPTTTGEYKTAEFLQKLLAQCGDGDGDGDGGTGDDKNKQLLAVLASLPKELIQKALNAHAVEQIITAIKAGLVTEEAVGKYLGVNVEFNAETNELTFTNHHGKELNLDEIPRLPLAGGRCALLEKHCGTEQSLERSNAILVAINKSEQTNQELVQTTKNGIALKTSPKNNLDPNLEETTNDLFAIGEALDKIEASQRGKGNEIVNLHLTKGDREILEKLSEGLGNVTRVKGGEEGKVIQQPQLNIRDNIQDNGKTLVGATQDRGGGHGM